MASIFKMEISVQLPYFLCVLSYTVFLHCSNVGTSHAHEPMGILIEIERKKHKNIPCI